mmetsp:Transcript_33093/g.32229  ORF Transcript_33093/g.32229 Transcript_33093/m.32229 type:complete len:97 (-) Transcript_33093:132-422(-)|eukprot:CAMPEP_0170541604 /NCGR_PEP_ID=MMETSP0211-20121228/1297_1 /TAXON_ID=311385 /ORGANISM="Pseudokeronopsis sp., Strain OXSARD2" /LENGTH=96 /DNA_ID=CAMNT_0010844399 /DNA_START=116 /DNA_END=406 /DNA_ORIENTATION=+
MEQEIETLTASFQQLSAAHQKFGDSKLVLNYMEAKAKDQEIMVPLTSSLYVPGVMHENNRVMVEVGAGYFVEESVEKAKNYCDRRVKMLQENATKL